MSRGHDSKKKYREFYMLKQFKYALFAGVILSLSPVAYAETPKDTLVIAKTIDDIISLDPAEAYEFMGIEVIANTYDRIMRFEPTDINTLVPGMAEGYTLSDDGKTFTFKMRAGQKFASGNPVTAADAVFSLQRVVKLDKTPAFLLGQLAWTKDNVDSMVKVVDDSTFTITIGEDFAPSLVLALLSSVVGSVVDMKVAMEHETAGDMGNAWLKTNSAGSGAYNLKSWKASESVSLEANENYRGGMAALKRVIIKHVAEPAAQRLLIEKGDIDIARDMQPDQIAGVSGNADIAVTTIPQAALYYVALNLKTTAFQDIKVRKAMRHLIDYEGMANSFLKGKMKVHQTFWPSGFWAALDENQYSFDPAKAKALLAEAGVKEGTEFMLDTPNKAPYNTIAQAVQDSMAKGGIKVTLVPAEEKAVLTKYRARGHQMLIESWGPDFMDPHTNADTFARNTDNSDEPKSKPLAWRNSWDIPELSKRTDMAVRERDADKRKQMYLDLQRDVMDQSPVMVMFQDAIQVATRANVKGYVMGSSSDVVYYNLTTK
jgi:peptide/nickel transport system substrate-binding protein